MRKSPYLIFQLILSLQILGANCFSQTVDEIVVTAKRLTLEQQNIVSPCFDAAGNDKAAEERCYELRSGFYRVNEAAEAAGQRVNYCRFRNGICVPTYSAEEMMSGNSLGSTDASRAASPSPASGAADPGQCYYQAAVLVCPSQANETGEGAITGNSNSSAANIESILQRYDTQCREQLATTERCCQDPQSCLADGGNEGSALLGSMQAILGAAGQSAALSGACGQMKNVALSATALNAMLARNCSNKINQCKQACNSIREEASRALSTCTTTTCSTDSRSRLRVITSANSSCERNESYAQEQASQGVATALTAKTMGLCKEATTSQPNPGAVALNNLNIDCSNPASASNPACQNACNRAGAQNDPACNPALGGGGGFGTGGSALVDPNGKFKAGAGALDEIEAGQEALAEDIAPVASKVSSSSPGGGANLPGGGEDLGGGAGGRSAGAGGDSGGGIDPGSIGSGFRSGNGYVSSARRSVASNSDGGAFDFAALAKMKDGKPFNPKDFLPGGRLDPKRRLAGLGASNSEIGAVHGDIFKNITNRFYQVCLRDALMDCESLRKNSNPGK